MAVRATQGVITSLSIAGAAHTAASQIVAVAMVTLNPTVRATAIQMDALGNPEANPAKARATWLTIEAIVWSIDPFTGKSATDEAGMPGTFPELPGLTYSVIKRPKWFTGIGASATGREVRVGYANAPLWEWDLTFDYLPDKPTAAAATPSDLKLLLGFCLAQGGALNGFNFRDPDDCTVAGQPIGVGDYTQTNFLLVRTFGGALGTATEPIGFVDARQPFNVYRNAILEDPANYDVVTTLPLNQMLRFHTAPGGGEIVTVDMGFFYYVRFKDDTYDFEKFIDRFWSQRLITLASLRG